MFTFVVVVGEQPTIREHGQFVVELVAVLANAILVVGSLHLILIFDQVNIKIWWQIDIIYSKAYRSHQRPIASWFSLLLEKSSCFGQWIRWLLVLVPSSSIDRKLRQQYRSRFRRRSCMSQHQLLSHFWGFQLHDHRQQPMRTRRRVLRPEARRKLKFVFTISQFQITDNPFFPNLAFNLQEFALRQ